jgi:hypothetical protein
MINIETLIPPRPKRSAAQADGGEYVGPPVPGGDEQQDAKQNRVRRKKE